MPDTLGDAGLLVRRKHLPAIAELVDLVLGDESLRHRIAERQTGRLRHFDPREVEQRFLALIESLVG